MDILNVFANNLKNYRIKRGFSQEIVSKKSGLHRTYISAIEHKRRNISLNNIQKIADTLGIDTYLLFIENKDFSDIKKKESICEQK